MAPTTTTAPTVLQTVSDIHHGPGAAGFGAEWKCPEQALGLTTEFVERVSDRPEVSGVINLGDTIEHTGTSQPIDAGSLQAALKPFEPLVVPVHHVAGNHDLMNLSEEAVARMFNRPRLYYSEDIGPHHLVVLCSRPAKRDGSGARVDDTQMRWLADDLAQNEKPAIICVHHPLSDQDLTGNRWFEQHPACALVENRDEVRGILRRHGNVLAVLNGHTHWNHLDVHDNIPYVTQQSLTERLTGGQPPLADTHGVVTLKGAQFGMEILGNDTVLYSGPELAQETGRTYDSIAEAYRRETGQWGQAERDEFDKVAAMLPAARLDKSIIDYGCGPARDAAHFISRGFRYMGVDASAKFIEHARQAVPEGIFFHQDFAQPLPELQRSADIAWHSSSLQHVKHAELPAVLQTAFDALKPGGFFYGHYRSGDGESLSISTEYGRPIARFIALYQEAEMNAALKHAGFEIVKSWTFDHKYEGVKGVAVKYKTRVIARKPL